MQKPWGSAHWLAHPAFIKHPEPPAQGCGTAHSELAHSISVMNQNVSWAFPKANLKGAFYQGFLPSREYQINGKIFLSVI